MIDYVFFTLNNFSHDEGGTVRIRGIVNALAECGMQVTLISNMKNDDGFHQRVNHIDLALYSDYVLLGLVSIINVKLF